jgi:hypothetical protein
MNFAWVLIVATGSYQGGVTSVPGFESYAACETARVRVKAEMVSWDISPRTPFRAVCVRLTEEKPK